MKKLVEGTSSPASAGEAETEFPAGSESAEQQEEAVEGEVDDERERRVGAGWDAHLLNGTGWRIGLGGRKIFIEFELFNIYSPTGTCRFIMHFCKPTSFTHSILTPVPKTCLGRADI